MKPGLLVYILPVLVFFIAVTIPDATAQGILSDYQQFTTAYTTKDYNQCLRLGAPLAKATDHPGIQYKLAECYCQTNQLRQSLDLLETLAARGLSYRIAENTELSPLYGDKRFITYTQAFERNRVAINPSTVSFIAKDSSLIPEGIASTSRGPVFYLGSLAKSKVVRCSDTDNCSDFITGEQAGFWMVLGMKVSPDAKSLWICSASERDSLNGYSGIFQFEIPSGKLLQKIVLDNTKGQHLFNDLAIVGNDDLYFTDSKAGNVWRKPPGSNVLTQYATGFVYPNGTAVDEERKILFVADYMGLYAIDLTTGKKSRLNHQGKTYLNGIDGLYYYKGSLIAIQDSGYQDDRIVKFQYNVKKNTITRTVTLQSFRDDFIIPTTGTIESGHLYYIANSQLRSLKPDGSLTNPDKLLKPIVLKLKLD